MAKKGKREYKKQPQKRTFLTQGLWFLAGFSIAIVFLFSFTLILFLYSYRDRIFNGVYIDNVYVGGKTRDAVKSLFDKKNQAIGNISFILRYQDKSATISAAQSGIGYDSNLIAEQAYTIGRSNGLLTSLNAILGAYFYETHLPSSYSLSGEKLKQVLDPIQKQIYVEPVDALFKADNNRVVAFRQSVTGKTIDYDSLMRTLQSDIRRDVKQGRSEQSVIQIPVTVLYPNVTTREANNFGIVEEIGEGVSYYAGSAENRIHNIVLAASKMNGVLVSPGEVFSFDKTLGDVSEYTGYKQAYIIQNGKTILGDGGGVCQVSTTLFRAILNAGLPITERHAHAYRVYYYEENSAPGLDATVYSPTVDLKFKNDTGHYILIEAVSDVANVSLTFRLYGKNDGRTVVMTTPVVTSQTPPPPAVYQDDPTLPAGTVVQTEHETWGANVWFKRIVSRDGKVLYENTFSSTYTPWAAVFLRGTGT